MTGQRTENLHCIKSNSLDKQPQSFPVQGASEFQSLRAAMETEENIACLPKSNCHRWEPVRSFAPVERPATLTMNQAQDVQQAANQPGKKDT